MLTVVLEQNKLHINEEQIKWMIFVTRNFERGLENSRNNDGNCLIIRSLRFDDSNVNNAKNQ